MLSKMEKIIDVICSHELVTHTGMTRRERTQDELVIRRNFDPNLDSRSCFI
jgi:hypothetical protein